MMFLKSESTSTSYLQKWVVLLKVHHACTTQPKTSQKANIIELKPA